MPGIDKTSGAEIVRGTVVPWPTDAVGGLAPDTEVVERPVSSLGDVRGGLVPSIGKVDNPV